MKYENIAYKIQAGDVFAFGGYGGFSDVIKPVTDANVTHVGVVLENVFDYNRIVESATIKDFCGVSVNFARERIENYHGEIWWMPLKLEVRKSFQPLPFYDFLLQQIGKHYDIKQALLAGIDILDMIGIAKNKEDYKKMFCSEIVGAALEVAGIIDVNASELTPIDICHLNIYSGCYQLKGDELPLEPFILEEEEDDYGSSMGDLVGDSDSNSTED
jgi:hypothetical protein